MATDGEVRSVMIVVRVRWPDFSIGDGGRRPDAIPRVSGPVQTSAAEATELLTGHQAATQASRQGSSPDQGLGAVGPEGKAQGQWMGREDGGCNWPIAGWSSG